MGGVGNLTTLIKRLEAATSRLEDIAASVSDHDLGGKPKDSGHEISDSLEKKFPQFDDAFGFTSVPPNPLPFQATPTGKSNQLPRSLVDLDDIIETNLRQWVNLSMRLKGIMLEQVLCVIHAFFALRDVIIISNKSVKPVAASADYMLCFHSLQKEISKSDDIAQNNFTSPFRDHVQMVATSLQALSWVTVENRPAEFFIEMFGGAQMYGNRILNANKESGDIAYVEWVQTFYKVFKRLSEYIKEHFPDGLVWDAKGLPIRDALRNLKNVKLPAGCLLFERINIKKNNSISSERTNSVSQSTETGQTSEASNTQTPPPPPPPLATGKDGGRSGNGGGMSAIYEQINQGEGIVSNLRKINKSNVENDKGGNQVTVNREAWKVSRENSIPLSQKPARTYLKDNRWIVENYDAPEHPIDIKPELHQSILVCQCNQTIVRVTTKGAALSADSSTRLSIIVDSLVSSLEAIKCPNFALQVSGFVPTILLDQVDGANVYLAAKGLSPTRSPEIFTSKCSAINVVLLPNPDEEYDGLEPGAARELPIPEQFRTIVRDGKLVTGIVEHVG